MDQNTFDVTIENFQRFAEEIFSPGGEDKFKGKLMEALDQIMKIGKRLNIKRLPMANHNDSSLGKKIKLSKYRTMDLPNEIWTKIIKFLPSKDVYGSLTLVSKRFQSLAIASGVLRIIDVSRLKRNKKVKILKHFTTPMKLILNGSISQNDLNVISMTKNLKSLSIRNSHFETFDMYGYDYDSSKELEMTGFEAFKHSNLEHLELQGYVVDPDVMIEITKIKTLKTFKISNAKNYVIDPKVVNAFAQNENQLENVEFDDVKNGDPALDYEVTLHEQQSNELNKALNNLLEKKSLTLKSLKRITWDGICDSEIPLTNLKLCQNLQEFCGILQPHDIEILAELPRLQKLKLQNLRNPKYLLDHLDLGSLKYLALSGPITDGTILLREIPKHNFPVLQRLNLKDITYKLSLISEKFLSNLISNAPNLKSISFGNSKLPLSHQFMYNFLKNSNIFVSFQSKSFEDFLIKTDLIEFRKYYQMKQSFKDWSLNNPEY